MKMETMKAMIILRTRIDHHLGFALKILTDLPRQTILFWALEATQVDDKGVHVTENIPLLHNYPMKPLKLKTVLGTKR
jgi:hypothetical protein